MCCSTSLGQEDSSLPRDAGDRMSAKYWMTIGPILDDGKYRVDYQLPNQEFSNITYVNEEMARMLKRAIEAGKEQAREQIRHALGIEG